MAGEGTPQEVTIKVNGIEYPFPSFDTLTYKEARFIKRETGLVMGQFFNALEQGDPDALMAVALVAMQRDGKPFDTDELDGLLLDKIEIIVPKEPVEEAEPTSPLPVSEPGSESESDDEQPSNVVELSGS